MNDSSVSMTDCEKFTLFFEVFFLLFVSKNFAFPKKLGIGAIMLITHASLAIPLITPDVFPDGKTAVSTAQIKTVPIILSKYPFKITPPKT